MDIRSRARREARKLLTSLEPKTVAVVTDQKASRWARDLHTWFPGAAVRMFTVESDDLSDTKTELRKSTFDMIIDDARSVPSSRSITWMLRQVNEHGAYVSLEGGDALRQRLADVQRPVNAQTKIKHANWVKTAVLRGALGEITHNSHATVVRRRGRQYTVDLLPFGSYAADGSIDLGVVHLLDCVVVGSPEQPWSGHLVVQATNEGTRWHDVITADLDSVTGERLTFRPVVWAQHLRIVVSAGTDLPALQVQTFPRDCGLMPHEKLIMARRTDGFGERMNALLSALRLSEMLGVGFGLTWNDALVDDPDHAIVRAEEMFSEEFRAAYLDTANDSTSIVELRGTDLTFEQLDRMLLHRRALHMPSLDLARNLDVREFPGLLEPYGKEFDRIGLAPAMLEAVDTARTIELPPNPAAIHIRGGDLVRGQYRQWSLWSDKAMALPVARATAERLSKDGRTVLVIGQEPDVVEELRATAGTKSVDELGQPEWQTRAEKALFELILLSRCEPIIAGTSGFAFQASRLNGQGVTQPDAFFSPADQQRICIEDLAANGARYSPLQAAFGYWRGFQVHRESTDADLASKMLSTAGRLDPDNVLYPLTEAGWFYRERRIAEGDAVLGRMLDAEWSTRNRFRVFDVFAARRVEAFLMQELIDIYEQVREESPIAGLLLAPIARTRLDVAEAARLASAAAPLQVGGLLADIDADLVEEVMRSTPIQAHFMWAEEDRAKLAEATAAWRVAR